MSFRINKETAKDVLITCVEGGSNYWAGFKQYQPDNGTVLTIDLGDGAEYPITAEDIQKAAQDIILGEHVATWVFADFPDDFDSITADCLLQFACFGEIVYG